MLLQDPMVLSEKMKDVYIRMECMADLETWLQMHTLTEKETIRMMAVLCETLMDFEVKGILHRDIKPENIYIDEKGAPRLGDFGSAAVMGGDPSPRGSLAYMAPEVYHGKAYDHRADIYSLGMVFYELMNDGRMPFTDSGKQILSPRDKKNAFDRRMKGEELPRPILATEDYGLVLVKACTSDPNQRYQSPKELMEDLRLLLDGKEPGKTRRNGGHRIGYRRAALIVPFLVAALLGSALLAGLYLPRQNSYTEYSLQVGPYAYASLQRDGTLVLSGKGPVRCPYGEKEDIRQRTDKDMFSSARRILVKSGISSINLVGIGYDGTDHFPQVEEIVLQEGVKQIEDACFKAMPSLKQVRIPDSVEKIGKAAFCNCNSLEEITLPAHLKKIEDTVFSQCYQLKKILIPESVEEIGVDSFKQTLWMEETDKGKDYLMVNHILVCYLGLDEEVIIPEEAGIRNIAFGAFKNNTQMKKLILPETVESIGSQAFLGCTGLESIRLPEKLTVIKEMQFYDCLSLKEIILPPKITSIENEAFYGCSSIKEISLPDSITYIGSQAFAGTPYLAEQTKKDYTVVKGILLEYNGSEKHLRIPEELKLTGIAGKAFYECNQLESIELPEGIQWLGEYCFYGCSSLKNITFPESLSRVEGGINAFSYTAWHDNQEYEKEESHAD